MTKICTKWHQTGCKLKFNINMIYKIKTRVICEDFVKSDIKRRRKVEEALGKQLSDTEWLDYKKMTMHRKKS